MTRLHYLLVTGLAIILTTCVPTTTATDAPTSSVSTAAVSIVEPTTTTDIPLERGTAVTSMTPTLTPVISLLNGLTPTELKYRVLVQFPDLFFCDPDYYPVAGADELDLARQRFPELKANSEEFNTILAHNNLAGITTFSDDQILLIYREHKKLAAIQFESTTTGHQFQLQVAKTEGNGEIVTGLIDDQGTITIQQRNPSIATCPICLTVDTLIDTPTGPIAVQSLREGTLVWTMDKAGARVALPLIHISKTAVPATHQVVDLLLNDGRELRVSPGHPTTDGRTMGQLQIGNSLDGAVVLSAERVPYDDSATYDLLPAGNTGFYWANEILIASTLIGPLARDENVSRNYLNPISLGDLCGRAPHSAG